VDRVIGFRCAACDATVDVAQPLPWRCPRSTDDDRHHVLEIVSTVAPLRAVDDPNPFVAFGPLLAWRAFARAHGMAEAACDALVREVDAEVAAVAGTGFVVTPFRRRRALSEALGFTTDGGVWVKDETRGVGGSHKARHLLTILLHLRAAELLGLAPWGAPAARPRLAIASCGNAALAAATLARASSWPIEVFVPPWASGAVTARLGELGADVVVCPRGEGDPPGDPCVHRFRAAVAAGAVPFSVQGPENALCLDGGRTLGWEMTETLGHLLDRVFVQVGGGAFASSLGGAFRLAGIHPRIHAVQAAGCAPLARAWERSAAVTGGRARAGRSWGECMWPWDEAEPASLADGILDDETYDWLGVLAAMSGSGGGPVVATEAQIVEAHELARRTTDVDVSATGSAGLAGLLAIRDQVADDERVAVVFSGVRR